LTGCRTREKEAPRESAREAGRGLGTAPTAGGDLRQVGRGGKTRRRRDGPSVSGRCLADDGPGGQGGSRWELGTQNVDVEEINHINCKITMLQKSEKGQWRA
jgi:hypothetical protein